MEQEGKQRRRYLKDKNLLVVNIEEIIKTFESIKSINVEENQQLDNKENH